MATQSEIEHAKDIYAALLQGWLAGDKSLDPRMAESLADMALMYAEAFAKKARAARQP